jgi:cathepsin D
MKINHYVNLTQCSVILFIFSIIPKISVFCSYLEYDINEIKQYHRKILRNIDEEPSYPGISLIDMEDKKYAVKVTIGDPPQNFLLLFDTSSLQTWVRDSNCQYCSFVKNTFEITENTKIHKNKTITITNLAGVIKGKIIEDNIAVENLRSNKMNFVVVTEDNLYDNADGVLGMSYTLPQSTPNVNSGSIQDPKSYSFLEKLHTAKVIKERIFTLKFKEEGSKITIGSLPSLFNQKNITRCKIKQDLKNWNCAISHVLFSNEYNFYKAQNLTDVYAHFSSSTSHILIPEEHLEMFNRTYSLNNSCTIKTDGKKSYILCNKNTYDISHAPPLNLLINGYAYVIPSNDLFEEIYSESYNQYYLFKIFFISTPNKQWILGHVFLKQYITIFDRESNSMGFYGGIVQDYTKFTSDEVEGTCYYNYVIYILIGSLMVFSMGYTYWRQRKQEMIMD